MLAVRLRDFIMGKILFDLQNNIKPTKPCQAFFAENFPITWDKPIFDHQGPGGPTRKEAKPG
jgi:hypothetical protein